MVFHYQLILLLFFSKERSACGIIISVVCPFSELVPEYYLVLMTENL